MRFAGSPRRHLVADDRRADLNAARNRVILPLVHHGAPNRCLNRLREMQAIARKHGGRCLSQEYVRRQGYMDFVCRAGHVWRTMPQTILNGGWCRVCAYVPKDGLKKVRALARERGGRCVSDEYIADKPGMEWSCAEGHRWTAKPSKIRQGSWCPTCALNQRRTLADMQAIAARHGGKCLSPVYLPRDACLLWACAKGHEFSIRPRCVRRGQWCPVCARTGTSWPRALALAADRGGALVTRRRADTSDSVVWRCAAGHRWSSNAHRVARGAWCPYCAGHRRTIEDMQALAAAHDGRCVSKRYVDQDTKLRWECERGHRWWTRPANVRRGAWCPDCAWDEHAARMRSEAKDRR